MHNLLNQSVQIDNFLTTDPFNKRGKAGIVTKVEEIDEDNADVTIQFEDGTIGVYQLGTFEIV
jgi:hypothetical protein